MDNRELSEKILDLVGGKENVSGVTHCITRLRIVVRDVDAIDDAAVTKLPGVMGSNLVGAQYQVILGPKVADAFKEFQPLVGGEGAADAVSDEKTEKKSLVSVVIDTLTGIFVPIIPAMIGAGLIKGILLALMFAGVVDTTTYEYRLLSVFTDAIYYFLPILLACSTAEHFKCNKYVAMAIAGILVHPDLMAMMTGNDPVSFLGIPVFKATYSSSVVPIVLSILFMSYVERFLAKHVPSILRTIGVPVLTILIVAPVTLWVLGPIGSIVSNAIATNFVAFYLNFGVIAGALFGGLFPLMVLLGIHNGFSPIMVQNLATYGVEYLMGLNVASNSAQSGASFAFFFKTKNPEFKEMAGSAAFSALLGVTEPALYGVTAKLKRPLVAVCLGGAVGGAIAGLFHVTATGMGTGPIVGIPLFFTDTFVYFVVSCVVAFVVGFVACWIIGFEDVPAEGAPEQLDAVAPVSAPTGERDAEPVILPVSVAVGTLGAPVAGEVRPLSECADLAFASGTMGEGVVIEPAGNKVYAPCDATVTALFPTLHAVGLTTDDGVEILIHVGMDTVELNGEGFTAYVAQGDRVRAGQLLLEFDADLIRSKGYSLATPFIVANASDYPGLTVATGAVEPGQRIISL